jgi:hypothetical protein
MTVQIQHGWLLQSTMILNYQPCHSPKLSKHQEPTPLYLDVLSSRRRGLFLRVFCTAFALKILHVLQMVSLITLKLISHHLRSSKTHDRFTIQDIPHLWEATVTNNPRATLLRCQSPYSSHTYAHHLPYPVSNALLGEHATDARPPISAPAIHSTQLA